MMAGGGWQSGIWKATLVVLLAGILAGALFWLSQSSLLAVNDIVIDGNRVVTDEQVLEQAGPLLRGQSIVRPAFDAARGELEKLPYVEEVDFERDFPNTIVIHIREQRPVVCLQAAGGKSFLVSTDGRVLSEQPAASSPLPVLKTREPCAAATGDHVECDDVHDGIQFLVNIPVSFNYDFAEVAVDNGDIRARTKNGVDVHFGSLDDYGLKFEVLRQLLARSTAAGAQVTIDVSVPERPVTREEAPPPPATTTAAVGAAPA